MTIAPCGALVKAAHEPSPAKGLSGTPSTLTFTSFRAQAMRTTPSGVAVALVAAADAIRSTSRWSSDAEYAGRSEPAARMPAIVAGRTKIVVRLIICLLGVLSGPRGGLEDAFACLPD